MTLNHVRTNAELVGLRGFTHLPTYQCKFAIRLQTSSRPRVDQPG